MLDTEFEKMIKILKFLSANYKTIKFNLNTLSYYTEVDVNELKYLLIKYNKGVFYDMSEINNVFADIIVVEDTIEFFIYDKNKLRMMLERIEAGKYDKNYTSLSNI